MNSKLTLIFLLYSFLLLSSCGGNSGGTTITSSKNNSESSSSTFSSAASSVNSTLSSAASSINSTLEFIKNSHERQIGQFAIDENSRLETHGPIKPRDSAYSKMNYEDKINTYLNESFEYIYTTNQENEIDKVEIQNQFKFHQESDILFIKMYFSGDDWGLSESESTIYVKSIEDNINSLYLAIEIKIQEL